MSTSFALAWVLALAFVLGQVADALRPRLVVPAAGLHAAIGIAAGPLVLGALGSDLVARLEPAFALLLALVGFETGLLLRRQLRATRGVEAGLLGGVFVVAAIALAAGGVLWALDPQPERVIWPALAIGAVGGATDSRLVGDLADRAGARGPVRDLVRALGVATSLAAIGVLGLSLALARAGGASALALTPTEWLLASLAIGAVCGLLFTAFVGARADDPRAFLATAGTLAFLSGMASALGISPLLSGAVAGLTASAVSERADDVGATLEPLQAPALAAVAILAGAIWTPPAGALWLLPVVFVVARVVAVRTGAFLVPRLAAGLPRAHRLGDALLPQGALGLAIATDFAQVFPQHAAVVSTTAIVGLVVSDAWGAPAVRRVLAEAGEIAHRVAPDGGAP